MKRITIAAVAALGQLVVVAEALARMTSSASRRERAELTARAPQPAGDATVDELDAARLPRQRAWRSEHFAQRSAASS